MCGVPAAEGVVEGAEAVPVALIPHLPRALQRLLHPLAPPAPCSQFTSLQAAGPCTDAEQAARVR